MLLQSIKWSKSSVFLTLKSFSCYPRMWPAHLGTHSPPPYSTTPHTQRTSTPQTALKSTIKARKSPSRRFSDSWLEDMIPPFLSLATSSPTRTPTSSSTCPATVAMALSSSETQRCCLQRMWRVQLKTCLHSEGTRISSFSSTPAKQRRCSKQWIVLELLLSLPLPEVSLHVDALI